MKLRSVRHAFNRSLAKRGFVGTFVFASRRALGLTTRGNVRKVQHYFDQQYGVQTSGVIFRDEGDERHDYHGVTPSVFRAACRRWQQLVSASGNSFEEYTFVDLGCGMGRALLMASEFPFRQVIGVEFDGRLTEIAQTNIQKWITGGRALSPISVLQQDVLEYDFPQPPLLVFLYNPFGETILDPVLRRLQQLKKNFPGPIDILYVHPQCSYLFDDRKRFQLLWSEKIEFDEFDKATDDFGSSNEICSIYSFC